MNDDSLINTMLIVILVLGVLCIIFAIVGVDAAPDKIKDTNCIYYEEQIYCLQESEGE
jgi:hypothetical protein